MDKLSGEEHEKVTLSLFKPDLMSIIIAVVVGLVIVAIVLVLRKKASSRRRDFLLMGLSESGKSAIFMQVLHKRFPDTFTSMTENAGEYKSGRMKGRLVDIPGHYRVRDKYFDQYKRTAKGIIFVVDSLTVQREIRDLADVLYTILADSFTQSCSFLILCNKQDITTAKSAQVIKNLLEKEMNIVRDTRRSRLEAVGEDGVSKYVYIGKEGKDFEFAQLQQNVQFYECSAKQNELNNLTDWIDRML